MNTDKAVAFMLQWKSVMQPCSGLPSNKKAREEIWSTYHTIRTSRKFVNLWDPGRAPRNVHINTSQPTSLPTFIIPAVPEAAEGEASSKCYGTNSISPSQKRD